MQFICLEQGIYRAEPGTDILGRPETVLSSYDFFRPDAPSGEMRELYLSPQITAIGEHALTTASHTATRRTAAIIMRNANAALTPPSPTAAFCVRTV